MRLLLVRICYIIGGIHFKHLSTPAFRICKGRGTSIAYLTHRIMGRKASSGCGVAC